MRSPYDILQEIFPERIGMVMLIWSFDHYLRTYRKTDIQICSSQYSEKVKHTNKLVFHKAGH